MKSTLRRRVDIWFQGRTITKEALYKFVESVDRRARLEAYAEGFLEGRKK